MITKLTDIKPNPNNPRVIRDENFKKLVNSIKEFPEMLELRPIVVNKDMVILGGNMRYRACQEAGLKEVPIKIADKLTQDQEMEFIIKDNVSGGDWDWEMLANEWDEQKLDEWGLDVPEFITDDGFGTEFELPSGDKSPFQQQTYTLSNEQAELIKNAILEAKSKEEFKYVETYGNENGNGNALYYIIAEWISQKS